MYQPCFTTAGDLSGRIDAYFQYTEGAYHLENKPVNGTKEPAAQKVWDREPEPATFSGLALFLGFNSRQAFDEYLETGEFADALKPGRLRIEAIYERKLHQQSSSGAIFALKNMGWSERTEKPAAEIPKTIPVEIMQSGPAPAESEKSVVL